MRLHNNATKTVRHPTVGEMTVTGEALQLPGDQGLTMIAYTVEPASKSAEALQLLASWAATAVPGTSRSLSQE